MWEKQYQFFMDSNQNSLLLQKHVIESLYRGYEDHFVKETDQEIYISQRDNKYREI